MNNFWVSTINFWIRVFQSVLMGCFVSCFRTRDREGNFGSRPRSRPSSNSCLDLEKLEERLVVDNQLGALFVDGEPDTEDNCDNRQTLEEELRLEAKHLKLCGAILETPLEIRKQKSRIALRELNGMNQSPNSAHPLSDKKIRMFAQCEQESNPDQTIIGVSGPGKEIVVSCQSTTGTGSAGEQESSPDQTIVGVSGPGKETPVSCQNTTGTGSAGDMRAYKLNLTPVRYNMGIRAQDLNSPYPTPINLDNDMQTPATIYSSYAENSITGKRQARIRAQYAYPALEPAQRAEVPTSIKSSEFYPTKKSFGETPKFLVSGEILKSSEETPKVPVPNLSEWLKPTTTLRGIPNTTTKYKEDQKVTWHTTPFEERLEKVLTDEKLAPSRKLASGRLIELEG